MPAEVNLFSYTDPHYGGYFVGETVYDPADTAKPASSVTVGQRGPIDPDPQATIIDSIIEGAKYPKGEPLSFTVVGAGMENTVPLAGDVRYEPASWSVNPNGVWSGAPYTARFETKDMALGAHTLSVVLDKETYNGTAWLKTGETATKSVSFQLVNRSLVKTGDSSLASTGALVLLSVLSAVVLFVARKRKLG